MAKKMTKSSFLRVVEDLKIDLKTKKALALLVKAHDAATVKDAADQAGLNE